MSELRCEHCQEVIKPNQTGGWYHVETSAHRSDQRCFSYATPASEPCRSCGGRGTWETECCNGFSGCPCRGGRVDMGSCHACGGTGEVPAGQQSPAANVNHILNNHISYPGGGPRGGW